ncbi:MAG: hypothetical protein KBT04_08185 [Bacteroidales bacterium]|nr:hypothetical protein [Candidatus Colimorpha onthohippi]
MNIKPLIPLLIVACALIACNKEIEEPLTELDQNNPTAWLLNEGVWNGNDAELSRVDLQTGDIINNYFETTNHRRLGDVAQDVLCYGSRLYIAMFGSAVIHVIDANSGILTKTIDLHGNGARYMATHEGKIYVSCYVPNAIAVIDTASLDLETMVSLQDFRPEGIIVCNKQLYVCSAWRYASNGSITYDNKVYQLSLPDLEIQNTYTVGLNPNLIRRLDSNKLAVACWGNYGKEQSSIAIINTTSHNITTIATQATQIDTYKGDIYTIYYDYYSTTPTQIKRIDGNTLKAEDIMTDVAKQLNNPYHLTIDPHSGNYYITDAQNFLANGDIYCVSPDGIIRWKSEATMGPSSMAFLK